MRTRLIAILSVVLTLSLTGLSFMYLPEALRWWTVGIGGLLTAVLALMYRGVIKPVIVAERGMEMLRSQDFNVRLVKVGEPAADKIVDLFNNLMSRLKNERLRLREQNSFLHLLIDASPMGIIMLDLDEKINMVNPALRKIAELPPDRVVIGLKMQNTGVPLIDELLQIPPGGSETIRLDGSRLFRGYHLWFIQDGFRRHFYLVETLTDEIRRAEKDAYEKVIRMISHEVNNTMGSVQTVLDVVAEDVADDPDFTETIESCRERTGQMCTFIRAFADIARIPEPVPADIDLNAQLKKLMPFLRVMVPEDIQFAFTSDSEVMPVKADVSLLQQVLVNIVKNAVESFDDTVGAPRFIRIDTSREGENVELCISNSGKPIDRDAAAHLFTPFYSTKRSGRGLGLMLISEVLSKHSCTFTLRTDPDSITRFVIRFKRQ